MNAVPIPYLAYYYHRTRNYDGSFNLHVVDVEVVGETAKSFRVRLLQPLCGYVKGEQMTVRRHNVRPYRMVPRHCRDYSNAWFNNL